jgi:hypothetical protein
MSAICTRCGHEGLIRLRGTLDWGVAYQLCATCHGVLCGLNAAEHERFAIDLWQRAAVRSLAPVGTG